jgi:hypothetical protein
MEDNGNQNAKQIQEAKSRSITIAQIVFLFAFFAILILDMFGIKPVPFVGFFATAFAAAAIGVKPDKIGEIIAAFFKRG